MGCIRGKQLIKMKHPIIYGIAAVLLIVTACNKDLDQTIVDRDVVTETESLDQVTVAGKVIDQSGNPIADAEVKILDYQTTTDGAGNYRFDNILIPNETSVPISAEKTGYFSIVRLLNLIGYLETDIVELLIVEFDKSIRFSGDQDTSISLSTSFMDFQTRDINIDLPAGPYLLPDGNSYDGQIHLVATLTTGQNEILDQFSLGFFNEYQGVDTDGSDILFSGVGQFIICALSDDGRLLDLPSASNIGITINEGSTTPQVLELNSLRLFSLDETESKWAETNHLLVNNGSIFSGTIDAFGNFAIGHPQNNIILEFTVRYADGDNISSLFIRRNDKAETGNIYSDVTNIEYAAYVLQNTQIPIQMVDDCFNVIYEEELGPFSENTTLDEIVLPSRNSLVLNAPVINCTGETVNPVYYQLIGLGNSDRYIKADELFKVCATASNFEIKALDIVNKQSSSAEFYSNGFDEPTNWDACGNDLETYGIVNYNNNTYLAPAPRLIINDQIRIFGLNDIDDSEFLIWIDIPTETNPSTIQLSKAVVGDKDPNSIRIEGRRMEVMTWELTENKLVAQLQSDNLTIDIAATKNL